MTHQDDAAEGLPAAGSGQGLRLSILLSVPLWGMILGGAALAVAGVRGALGPERAPALVAGKALLPAAPPAGPIPPAPRRPLMGLDAAPDATGEPGAAPVNTQATTDVTAPESRSGADDPGIELERRVREQVLEQLRDLGLVSSGSSVALSDTDLGAIAGGEAAAGSVADGGESDDGKDRDPQLAALNRVLVEKGGVLLPPWTVELQPELLYSYKGANGLLILEQNGVRSVVAHDADIDRLEAAITARLGLPWNSQAEVRVPYLRVSENTTDGARSDDRSASGLGDVELAFSHQFLKEGGWLPDLVGEVRWKTTTGEDSFDGHGPALGSGFDGIGGRVTLLKTYDPVVFLGSIGYTANLEDKKNGFDIDPGDTWSFSAATILAAGPNVSLRTGFSLAFTDKAEVDGTKVAGSDRTEAVLSLGAAVTLTPKALLDASIGVGVTDDAPDVATRVALAYRF